VLDHGREAAAIMEGARERLVVASGLREKDVLAGNLFDKYGSRNPIVRSLMRGFEESLQGFVALTRATRIHEVGCGEGRWTIEWAARGLDVRGSDFSEQVLDLARANCARAGVTASLRTASIYDLEREQDAAELVVCCEVLEHLEHPERAVDVLATLASPWLIASVPREPIWSAMNMARGKYWSSWGNTPGHIQRYSTRDFVRLLSSRFEVVAVRRPLPWSMALCRVREREDGRPA
jgi:2-polyprenyl-3-methyl-5-hydroxy-6-metoxy-1,4-benzoquinol methylase